jgi:hypothetical protein
MGSLKEFLQRQKNESLANESSVLAARDEWVACVNGLLERIREWLAAADPEHILTLSETTYEIRESGLGTYSVPGLTISLGPRVVRIEPVARYVVGPLSSTGVLHVLRAFGRVDMTDGLRRYYLYRTEMQPEDRWEIIEEDSRQLTRLEQDSFERALQSLLE